MKWEYLSCVMSDYVYPGNSQVFINTIVDKNHRTTIDDLGEDRWELVTINNNIAYFKRPKQDASLPVEQAEYFGGKVG